MISIATCRAQPHDKRSVACAPPCSTPAQPTTHTFSTQREGTASESLDVLLSSLPRTCHRPLFQAGSMAAPTVRTRFRSRPGARCRMAGQRRRWLPHAAWVCASLWANSQ